MGNCAGPPPADDDSNVIGDESMPYDSTFNSPTQEGTYGDAGQTPGRMVGASEGGGTLGGVVSGQQGGTEMGMNMGNPSENAARIGEGQGYGGQAMGGQGYDGQAVGGLGLASPAMGGPGLATPAMGGPGYDAQAVGSPGLATPAMGGQGFDGQAVGGPAMGGQGLDGQAVGGGQVLGREAVGGQAMGGQAMGGQVVGGQVFDGQSVGGQVFGGQAVGVPSGGPIGHGCMIHETWEAAKAHQDAFNAQQAARHGGLDQGIFYSGMSGAPMAYDMGPTFENHAPVDAYPVTYGDTYGSGYATGYSTGYVDPVLRGDTSGMMKDEMHAGGMNAYPPMDVSNYAPASVPVTQHVDRTQMVTQHIDRTYMAGGGGGMMHGGDLNAGPSAMAMGGESAGDVGG